MNEIIPNHLLVKLALKNSTLSTLVATFLQWRAQVVLVSIISKDHYMLHNSIPVINPILYGFFNENFRREVGQLYQHINICQVNNTSHLSTKEY